MCTYNERGNQRYNKKITPAACWMRRAQGDYLGSHVFFTFFLRIRHFFWTEWLISPPRSIRRPAIAFPVNDRLGSFMYQVFYKGFFCFHNAIPPEYPIIQGASLHTKAEISQYEHNCNCQQRNRHTISQRHTTVKQQTINQNDTGKANPCSLSYCINFIDRQME